MAGLVAATLDQTIDLIEQKESALIKLLTEGLSTIPEVEILGSHRVHLAPRLGVVSFQMREQVLPSSFDRITYTYTLSGSHSSSPR